MDPSKAQELIQKALTYLDLCNLNLEAGKEVDLSVFEKETQVLLEEISILDRKTAIEAGLEKSLEKLSGKLNLLHIKMVQRRDEIRAELVSLNKNMTAHSAYIKNQGVEDKKD